MAAEKTLKEQNLVIEVETAMDSNGKTKSKEYTFTGVNMTATPDTLLDVGLALADLMSNTPVAYYVSEKHRLAKQN